VDELLVENEYADSLRLFRNVTFHYQESPLSTKFMTFLEAKVRRGLRSSIAHPRRFLNVSCRSKRHCKPHLREWKRWQTKRRFLRISKRLNFL
jgi:hypothetical protein